MSELSAKQNQIIMAWTNQVKAALRSEIREKGLISSKSAPAGKKKLIASITHRFRKQSGDIFRIGFGGERHGWVAANVGDKWTWDYRNAKFLRGGMKGGRKGFFAKGTKISGRKIIGSGSARDWAFPIMDREIPILVERLAEIKADVVVNDSYVISTRGKRK